MDDSQSNVIKKVTELIEVKTERFKLKLVAKTAAFFSTALSASMFLAIAFFIIFFSSFGVAFLLNEVLSSAYLGFLILAGFYLVIIVVVFILFKRKIIQNFFESILIKLIDPEEDESED